MNQPPLVLYHAGCNDGFCAAWLCHLAWPRAEFVPAWYGMPAPDVTGRDVVVVDFSFPREDMTRMKGQAASLVVLDHHETARAALAGLEFCRFDMEKSGARLTWEWLCQEGHLPDVMRRTYRADAPPWPVAYTEDRDLGHSITGPGRLPDSPAVNAALATYPHQFSAWDTLWGRGASALVPEGQAVLRYQAKLIEDAVRHAAEAQAVRDGSRVRVVNTTVLISEIGHELARDRDFGVCWHARGDGKIVYQLRASQEGKNVAEFARQYGGGGHAGAAGFVMPPEAAPFVRIGPRAAIPVAGQPCA